VRIREGRETVSLTEQFLGEKPREEPRGEILKSLFIELR